MKIEFTGRQTDVSEPLRVLAERRVAKLARVLRRMTWVHVILTSDKHRQGAEVSVHSAHMDLSATEVTGDLGTSLAAAFAKLDHQAAHHVGRRGRRGRGRGVLAKFDEGLFTQARETKGPKEAKGAKQPGEPRVIRTRGFALKPMTIDEAVLESRLSSEGLVVFRDAKTERVTVLYRRKDGNLGLIEPEA